MCFVAEGGKFSRRLSNRKLNTYSKIINYYSGEVGLVQSSMHLTTVAHG